MTGHDVRDQHEHCPECHYPVQGEDSPPRILNLNDEAHQETAGDAAGPVGEDVQARVGSAAECRCVDVTRKEVPKRSERDDQRVCKAYEPRQQGRLQLTA